VRESEAFLQLCIDSLQVLRHTNFASTRQFIRALNLWPKSCCLGCSMPNLAISAASGSDALQDQASGSATTLVPAASQEPGKLDTLAVLRQSLEDATQSTESILRAIADAARVLSGADGTAIALHLNGTIICRARSGTIAPALGSPLNTDSGISGQCLRSATILVCADAFRDERVDPDVCRGLGIRSIAVVPLRGRLGMAGILEAFSAHPGTFDNRQIECLRSLGEIAEQAYDREQLVLTSPASPVQGALAAAAIANFRRLTTVLGRVVKKDYRIIAASSLAVLLISIVIWMSWRDTQAEIAASESRPHVQGAAASRKENSLHAPLQVVPLSPVYTGARTRSNDRHIAGLMQNAADVASAANPATPVDNVQPHDVGSISSASPPLAKEAAASPEPEVAPPSVDLALANNPSAPVSVVAPVTLPEFGGVISQGLKEATLIHRVEPMYPPLARLQKLAGQVVLDASVTKDGKVRATKLISGPPLLAEAASTAVHNWRFSPATLDGKPIDVQMRVTVVFKLP
jgi:TonB family protein